MKKLNRVGQFQLKVNISLAVVLFALGLAAIIVFQVFPSYRGILIFGAAILGGMATLYTAFYIGKSLRIQLERDAVRQSFDLIEVEDTIELNQVRILIDEKLYHKEIPPSQMYQMISQDTQMNNAVITVLNQFESVSVAIQKGFADEAMLLTTLGWRIPFYFKTLEPYVREIRKVFEDDKLFIETEKLVRAWDAKKYLYSDEAIA